MINRIFEIQFDQANLKMLNAIYKYLPVNILSINVIWEENVKTKAIIILFLYFQNVLWFLNLNFPQCIFDPSSLYSALILFEMIK